MHCVYIYVRKRIMCIYVHNCNVCMKEKYIKLRQALKLHMIHPNIEVIARKSLLVYSVGVPIKISC